jgi:hypothetical protein
MTRPRPPKPSRAERDERIVAEANEVCGQWLYVPELPGQLCQQYENYDVMSRGCSRRNVMDAAARILNRLARKRRGAGKGHA